MKWNRTSFSSLLALIYRVIVVMQFFGISEKLLAEESFRSFLHAGISSQFSTANIPTSYSGLLARPVSFTSAQAFAGLGGFAVEYGFTPLWSFGSRFHAVMGFPTRFLSEQNTLIAVGGRPEPAVIEHELALTSFGLQFEPFIAFQATDVLQARAGLSFLQRFGTNFTQSERFISPETATFPSSGTNSQTLASGTFSGVAQPSFGAYFGVQAQISDNFQPEISAVLPMNEGAENSAWKMTEIRLSASVPFTFFAKNKKEKIDTQSQPRDSLFQLPEIFTIAKQRLPQTKRDTVYLRDTVNSLTRAVDREQVRLDSLQIREVDTDRSRASLGLVQIREYYTRLVPDAKPLLSAAVMTRFVLDNGRETMTARATIREEVLVRTVPLLEYVFFDKFSTQIPARYKHISLDSAIKSSGIMSTATTLAVARNVLNIVGDRMQKFPKAQVSIAGCGFAEELQTTENISLERAKAVENYLVTNFGISSQRLKSRGLGLPANPSPIRQSNYPSDNEKSAEENRRAELTATIPEILAPVILRDTIRVADPPTIKFLPKIYSEAGIRDWKIEISQNGQILDVIRDTAGISSEVLWNMNDKFSSGRGTSINAERIEYRLIVNDHAGQQYTSPWSEIVFRRQTLSAQREERRGERLVERYSLILFDYGSSQLTDKHKKVLNGVVDRCSKMLLENQNTSTKKYTPPQTLTRFILTITGTTDAIGDENYNEKLSTDRARATAEFLGIHDAHVTGLGEEGRLFYGGTPEERFYDRTVHILIETIQEVVKNRR